VKKLVALASVLALGGSLGVAALFVTSPPSFVRARSYAAGRVPLSVAIGDLNADAMPDLAAANSDDNTVSVLFNRATAASEPSATTQPEGTLRRLRSAI
jgi:hypothetical protein